MILPCALGLLVGFRVAVFGDAHFDRGVRTALHGKDPAELLASTKVLRDSADVSILNLETPLCDSNAAPARKGGIRLRSDPLVAASLARAGFSAVTLANNHVMDRGEAGLRSTSKALADAGVRSVGADPSGDPCRPLLVGDATDSVAIFAWTPLPGIDGRRVCAELERVVRGIRAATTRRIPSLVVAHWGTEGNPRVSTSQVAAAAKFAAAGAAALVGHHAHVIQFEGLSIPSMEQGMLVWYGIGNFVFDQWEPWSRDALAVELDFSGGRLAASRTIELLREGPKVRIRR
ncbi:MAG: CapA family protein [Fibrobacterota bacterium]|nr:CapA family protein [Fibrobacterota bacterium]QQS06435.1 MAG: CapA family protein [Fibrobacterota bacterium]